MFNIIDISEMLLELPDEIIIEIIYKLSLQDIHNISQCNKRLNYICNHNNLWYKIIKNVNMDEIKLSDIEDPKEYCKDNYVSKLGIYYHGFSGNDFDTKYYDRILLKDIYDKCISLVQNNFSYEEYIKKYVSHRIPPFDDIVHIYYTTINSAPFKPKITISSINSCNTICAKVKNIKQIDIILGDIDYCAKDIILSNHRDHKTKLYMQKLEESMLLRKDIINKHIHPIIQSEFDITVLSNKMNDQKEELLSVIDEICHYIENENNKYYKYNILFELGFDSMENFRQFQLKYINNISQSQLDFIYRLNYFMQDNIKNIYYDSELDTYRNRLFSNRKLIFTSEGSPTFIYLPDKSK